MRSKVDKEMKRSWDSVVEHVLSMFEARVRSSAQEQKKGREVVLVVVV
jgi:hypothetical protein